MTKYLAELLTALDGPDVSELHLWSGRVPAVRRGTAVEPILDTPLSADEVVAILMALGGSRHVEDFVDKPKQWGARLPGRGTLAVVAVQRGVEVQAKVALQRDAAAATDSSPMLAASSARVPVAAPAAAPAQAPASDPNMPAGRPVAAQAAKLFEQVLGMARQHGASDILFIAGRPVQLRMGKAVRPASAKPLTPALVEATVLPLVPERLQASLEEEGSCDFSYQSPNNGRFRVNVARHQNGWMAVLRLIALEMPSVESLGLPPGVAAATHHHQGLVVFTGPTGHGKTTTLTAVVDLLNRTTTHHIITVEDPIEYLHQKKRALISQREIGTHTKSFASALKGSLREDPDVIVVGELRDLETVRMAVSASETGHLVLGTMNTPSASKTIDRLIDLFPPADQPQVRLTLASGLRLIVSQRLVPSPDRTRVHAALEILPSSGTLAALIRDDKTYQIPSLQQRGKGLGIVRLDESLAALVRAKKVALEDARAVAEAPGEFDALIRGGA